VCSVDAGTAIAVVAAIGAAYTTAALKLRRPDGVRTRSTDATQTEAGPSTGERLDRRESPPQASSTEVDGGP
jgi:hypothetical protein